MGSKWARGGKFARGNRGGKHTHIVRIPTKEWPKRNGNTSKENGGGQKDGTMSKPLLECPEEETGVLGKGKVGTQAWKNSGGRRAGKVGREEPEFGKCRRKNTGGGKGDKREKRGLFRASEKPH